MKTLVAVIALAFVLDLGNRPAPAAVFSSVAYDLNAIADDPALSPSPTMPNTQDRDNGQDQSDGTDTKTAQLSVIATEGKSSATGNGSYSIGKGVISVYANGDATARKPNALPAPALATFKSFVSCSLSDDWRFTFPAGVTKVKATGSFRITGNFAAGGSGASGSIDESNDEVGYSATASLEISGDGMPLAPHTGTSGGQFRYWAFQDRRLSLGARTESVVDQPLTTASIPIVIEATRSVRNLNWAMTVVAAGAVEARDHVNFAGGSAFAISDASHTLRWEGISSVVDADTGLPVTDWTLTSASGFDWTHAAVPEPTSLVLLAGPFVPLARRCRRRSDGG